MEWDKLGGEKEITKEKGIFLLFCFGLIVVMFYALIGAGTTLKNVLYFYIALLLASVVWIVVDMVTPQKELNMIDSVTIEDDAPLSPKINLVIGLVITGIMTFYITTTNQAFLSGSPFGVQMNAFESNVGNAFTSAIVGMIEVIFFFGVAYSVLHTTIFRYTDSAALATIIALLGISLVFMLFHWQVYRFQETSLMMVFFFGLFLQALPVLLTRNLTIALIAHGVNNFLVVLLVIQKFAILFVI